MEQAFKEKIKSQVLDFALDLLIIVILVFLIRSFLVAPFRVSGPSMCDTLNVIDGECVPNGNTVGEFILLNKLTYLFGEPQRGDVVVFVPPGGELHYIKRIIGIGGDLIEVNSDGYIYITTSDDKRHRLKEPYLNAVNFGNTLPANELSRKFEVPDGKFFVMGDNRAHSSDSRHCFTSPTGCEKNDPRAFIGESDIDGKALVTLWPFGNMKYIRRAEYGF